MFANQFEVGGRLADWAAECQSARVGAVGECFNFLPTIRQSSASSPSPSGGGGSRPGLVVQIAKSWWMPIDCD